MKTFYLIFGILFLSSCNDKYTYVETVKEKSFDGEYSIEKKEEIFSAANDSIAFIEAYKKFCISIEVANKMKEKIGNNLYSTPMNFTLYDKNGNKIENIISDKTLLDIKNSINKISDKDNNRGIYSESESSNINLIDSIQIKELSPNFIFEKDKFDPNGKTWIKHKDNQKYINKNDIGCYFMSINNNVSNFRFFIQYLADDWLFVQKYQFSIDGNAYEFVPNQVERDNGDGKIWEWSDDSINTKNKFALIKALAYSKEAEIKIIGRNYYEIKKITQKQINAIKETYQLYLAMGGIIK